MPNGMTPLQSLQRIDRRFHGEPDYCLQVMQCIFRAPEPHLPVLVAEAVHQRLVLPAVDFDHSAVDHVHQRRGQHHHEIGNLIDLGDPPERNGRRRQRVGFLVGDLHIARHGLDQASPALGAHRSRIDGDKADAALAILAGERDREILAGGVGRARADFPVGRLHAVIADQIDDAAAALLDHDRQRVSQAAHVAHELELQALFPVVLGQMLDHAAGRGAGIVDHNVDPAERLVTLLDEGPGVGILSQVGGDRHDLAAGGLRYLLGGGFQRLLAARADGDVDPFLGQCQSDALADAFAAARHERRLAVKS